jgi:GTPase SAR1 family protein
LEESPEKKILVLGLENAGKSSVLAQVTSGTSVNQDVKPTEGFNVTCLHSGGISLNIWESESAFFFHVKLFEETLS